MGRYIGLCGVLTGQPQNAWDTLSGQKEANPAMRDYAAAELADILVAGELGWALHPGSPGLTCRC